MSIVYPFLLPPIRRFISRRSASTALRLARLQPVTRSPANVQHQTRTAAAKAAPAQIQAQSIGGVKTGRKEKWEKKVAQERAHRARDVPFSLYLIHFSLVLSTVGFWDFTVRTVWIGVIFFVSVQLELCGFVGVFCFVLRFVSLGISGFLPGFRGVGFLSSFCCALDWRLGFAVFIFVRYLFLSSVVTLSSLSIALFLAQDLSVLSLPEPDDLISSVTRLFYPQNPVSSFPSPSFRPVSHSPKIHEVPREQAPATQDEGPPSLPKPFQPGSGHALDLPLFGRVRRYLHFLLILLRENSHWGTSYSQSTPTPKRIGQATSIPTSLTNVSKVFGIPNKMFLEYRILSTPTSIIRPITLTLTSTLSSAKGSSSSDSRIVLHGRAGSGKSYALHQAVQYAQAEGWVVVYVPRAVTLVNSTNSYIYDIRTQTYLKPNASYRLLNHILEANASLLSKIPLKHSFVSEKLTVEAGEGKTLVDLAQAGIKDKSQQSAPLVLDALLKGLEEQKEVPVLVAVDDFQSLFHDSAYRDPFFQSIKPHHLSLPRTLLEYSSGSRVLSNGVFLGAVTESDTTYTVPVELEDAVGMTEGGKGRKMGSEYVKRDEVREGHVKGVKGVEVPERMTLGEMAGLFGVWKEDMALTTGESVFVLIKYDELFMSKYVESDGNPRDFVWKGLLATMTP
ncbi:hypothetical protein NMY22_g12401 [Coprinellus aureogranulatus]|nr:hypothetical protein NMY22_g12401 [Coprinellus aureogranulatus]